MSYYRFIYRLIHLKAMYYQLDNEIDRILIDDIFNEMVVKKNQLENEVPEVLKRAFESLYVLYAQYYTEVEGFKRSDILNQIERMILALEDYTSKHDVDGKDDLLTIIDLEKRRIRTL